MRKRLPWLLLLLPVLAWLLLPRRAVPRHLFLITLDTMRADAVDYAPGGATPNLAALAAAGVRFDNAYSVIPITSPSHAAMFYSQPPHVLKLYNNGQARSLAQPSLAEVMKRAGYATGAVVSLAVLQREFGLDKGFDHYLENFAPGLWYRSAEEVNRDALALVDRLRAGRSFVWLHYSDPHEPYFPPGGSARFTVSCGGKILHRGPSRQQPVLRLPLELRPGTTVVTLETEPPEILGPGDFTGVALSDLSVQALEPGAAIDLEPSADLERRGERFGWVTLQSAATRSSLRLTLRGDRPCRAELAFKYQVKIGDEAKRRGYESEVRYLDAQLGRLFAHLRATGVFKHSLFLVMGDHGEGLGEYGGHFGHIHYLNKVYTHVPFFLSGAGVSARGARQGLVSNLNVAPTLLARAGIRRPRHMSGRDALQAAEPRLFLETYSPEAYFDSFAAVHYPWQVVFHPGRSERQMEFFDLRQGPHGTVDLQAAPDPSGRRPEMTRTVLRLSRIITANKRRQGNLDQKTMDTLKSLGYL